MQLVLKGESGGKIKARAGSMVKALSFLKEKRSTVWLMFVGIFLTFWINKQTKDQRVKTSSPI